VIAYSKLGAPMTEQDPEKLTMKSAMLDDRQKTLVILHLWTALRQTFFKMHELKTRGDLDFSASHSTIVKP
jgi:hypothetical protein